MKNITALFLGCSIIFFSGFSLIMGPIKKGEKLFNDPTLGDGMTGKTCATCHENGAGISVNFDKKSKYSLMGLDIDTLPEVINNCIEITLRGEGIDPKGSEMDFLISYIKALKSRPQK